MNRFEIDGVTFEQQHLKVDDACEGLELLAQILGPAAGALGLEEGAGDLAKALADALGQSRKMSPLGRLFAKRCKVSRKPDGVFDADGPMVELKPFFEDVFGGRLDLLMAFLIECSKYEFGNFLAGGGALGGLLAKA